MSQGDILKVLNDKYPKYLSFREILDILGLSKPSVIRCLKVLRKYNDVEVMVIKSKKIARWENLYRYSKYTKNEEI